MPRALLQSAALHVAVLSAIAFSPIPHSAQTKPDAGGAASEGFTSFLFEPSEPGAELPDPSSIPAALPSEAPPVSSLDPVVVNDLLVTDSSSWTVQDAPPLPVMSVPLEIRKPGSASPRRKATSNAGGGLGSGPGKGRGRVPAGTPPSYLSAPAPRYPKSAVAAGVTGMIIISGTVDTAGHLQEARIHRSSGNSDLDASALSAVKRWKFAPGKTPAGEFIPWPVEIPVSFEFVGRKG